MADPLDPEERRGGARFAVALRVDYDDAADLLEDYTQNLSTGGACIASTRELPVGTEIRLGLAFPGLVEPIRVRAIVRWSRGGDEPTLGVEFPDDSARGELAMLIDRIRAGDPRLLTRTLRVLIVEDNRHVAELIGHAFADPRRLGAGFAIECHHAADGGAALEAIRRDHYDALIVDVYLPVVDGPHLISAVREISPRVPILAMSAGGEAARAAAVAAGADSYLDKPLRLASIIDRVRALLESAAKPVD